ncbi:MAG: serine/threonine-protein kinase, partial [Planctomycetota bacterium]
MPKTTDSSAEADYSSLLAAYHESLVNQRSAPVDMRMQEELGGVIQCLLLMERNRQLTSSSNLDSDSVATEQQPTLGDRPGDIASHRPERSPSENRIGRFEIKRTLGVGGNGIVLLAYDPELRRDVALKVPKPEALLNEEFVLRFDREARIAAKLKHPNIVSVLESGAIGPIHYIATDYCNGPSLRTWIRGQKGQVAPQTAASMIRDLADALRHAHECGVLHRDIKPSNILFDASEEGIAVRLADFGLAKSQTDSADMTATGAVIGTPAYMAPEQAAGRLKDVGPHSDIFSIGVVLYELLTGISPFERQTSLGTLEAVRSVDIVSLESDSGVVVPPDLEAICLKCLRKKPTERYSHAAKLANDLKRFLDGESTRPQSRSTPRRIAHRVFACQKSIVSIAVVLGLIVANAVLLQSRSKLRDDLSSMTSERDETLHSLFRNYEALASMERQSGIMGQRSKSMRSIGAAVKLAQTIPDGVDEVERLADDALSSLWLTDLDREQN